MRPMEDIRIVSLEQYGAGTLGSMHLAELGAEIIKVAAGGGEPFSELRLGKTHQPPT